MFLGRVTGEMVATLKHRALERRRLLWVERTAPDGTGLGRSTLAVDNAQAGPGDFVLVLDEGNGASQVLDRPRGPIRTVIVGIVDEVDHVASGARERPVASADPLESTGSGDTLDPARVIDPVGSADPVERAEPDGRANPVDWTARGPERTE